MSRPDHRPILRGERIWRRPLEEPDMPLFLEWLNDADVAETMAGVRPWSQAQGDHWLSDNETQHGKTAWRFIICLRGTDEAIGAVGLDEVNLIHGHGELGLLIGDRTRWDQGYGTEATRVILYLGFGELRLERVHLYVLSVNARGRRTYEKTGFSHEGALRNMHVRHGRLQDWELMSILRDEWLAQEWPRSWQID